MIFKTISVDVTFSGHRCVKALFVHVFFGFGFFTFTSFICSVVLIIGNQLELYEHYGN